jgi:hypothetical protein
VSREHDFAIPRWLDPDWRAEVRDWVAGRLAAADRKQTGPEEQVRAMPWAAVHRVPTDAGPAWFKANGVGVAHEAGLYEVLRRRSPEHVLEPLSLDGERGWLLLPDGGPTLRDIEGARTDLGLWELMFVQYAELQRAVAPYADELVAVGVPDARPERMPAVRAALLADHELVMLGEDEGLTQAQYDELCAGSPAYADLCDRLAAFGIPSTLQHDDLHDHNVFAPAEPGGPLRVFDWGDAVVGHPFGTLLVTLRVVCNLTGLAYGAPELLRLRDAYLEPWTAEHDRADLAEAARLAVRVDTVSRADCYRRALLEATAAGRAEYGDGVPSWLLEQGRPTPLEP